MAEFKTEVPPTLARDLAPTKKLPRSNRLKEGSYFFRFVVWILSRFILSQVDRRDLGVEKIPYDGPAIIIAPHLNELDSMIAAQMVTRAGRMPRIFAKASLWNYPVVKQAFNSGKLIPVERGTANASKTIDIALKALEDGDTIVIYPEGTCSKDPLSWPMQIKTGAARLALRSGAPVIPIMQDGAQFVSKKSRKDVPWAENMIVNGRVVVNTQVYSPIDFSDLFTQKVDQPTDAQIEKVNDRIQKVLIDIVAQNRQVEPPKTVFKRPKRS